MNIHIRTCVQRLRTPPARTHDLRQSHHWLVVASKKGGTAPQFSAYVHCGQTAGWIKTPLGTEVDLGHIVLDGYPASSRERGTAAPPLFSAHVYCGHGRPSQLLLSSGYLHINLVSRKWLIIS